MRAGLVLLVATRASSHGCSMRRRFIVSAIYTISSTGQAVATAMMMRLVKSSFALSSKSFPTTWGVFPGQTLVT